MAQHRLFQDARKADRHLRHGLLGARGDECLDVRYMDTWMRAVCREEVVVFLSSQDGALSLHRICTSIGQLVQRYL